MKSIVKNIILIFLSLQFGCKTSQFVNQVQTSESTFEDWKQERFDNIKEPTGWASVVGLYFLNSDTLNIGSLEQNDIIFPENAPLNIGRLIKDDDNYLFRKEDHLTILQDEQSIDSCLMYGPDGESNTLNIESYYWFLIERDGQHYIRLKDTLSERRLELSSIPYFNFNKNLVLEATIHKEEQERYIPITNVLGVTAEKKVQGTIDFKYKGEMHQLIALDGGENQWFVIFADDTSGEETYGGGRFLDVVLPQEGTQIVLDFNRAYNPPCVFTDYATCPLPPSENRLFFAVNAGEKVDKDH